MDRFQIEAITRLSEGNIYNPHVFGLDSRELFFQEDNIILMEGQEDVLLLPKIASDLGVSIPSNFFGWGAGGAGNIAHICRILRELGFKSVCGVLDGDKIDLLDRLEAEFPDFHFTAIPADDIRTKAPRYATQGKTGVLDEDLQVRPEKLAPMREVLQGIHEYLQPR